MDVRILPRPHGLPGRVCVSAGPNHGADRACRDHETKQGGILTVTGAARDVLDSMDGRQG